MRRWLPSWLANFASQPDRDASIRRYARLAPRYGDSTAGIVVVRDLAVERLALRQGETVFDVACGAGAMLGALATRVGTSGRVIGIEQSPAMASRARDAAAAFAHVEVHEMPVEDFVAPRPGDAVVLVYAHDVQQNMAALANVFAQVRPGARVVAAGLCLLPWRRAPHVNAWVLWSARQYLTTWHGLREPWLALQRWCPDLAIVERFHQGTTYVATGTVKAS
jgi:SAM-dependent methyltransferase